MCSSPQMPKTYQATEAPAGGTWTPTKAYTQAEQDEMLAGAKDGMTLMGVNLQEQGIRRQIADRAGVAAADAAKLQNVTQQAARAPDLQQQGKGARAPVDPLGSGGGPTSLLTGGTAASALTNRKAANATLLGG